MKRIAVFGKPGSGKSTLSKALAAATDIPLHPLDTIAYKKNGEQVDRETFKLRHDKILSQETWIIDGFGPLDAFNKRLNHADTLIYIDLSYFTSYWFVTKRLIKGLFTHPEGWPKGSSVVKGSLQSYKILRLCPRFWNDDFASRLANLESDKQVFVIKNVAELNQFVDTLVSSQCQEMEDAINS